jgi:hypothetical protein
MNTAYLSMVELDEILNAILIGITAEEGLQFNRAFLALFDEAGETLEGRLAIGPGNREEGGRIWQDMVGRGLRLDDLLAKVESGVGQTDSEVNRIVHALRVNGGPSTWSTAGATVPCRWNCSACSRRTASLLSPSIRPVARSG